MKKRLRRLGIAAAIFVAAVIFRAVEPAVFYETAVFAPFKSAGDMIELGVFGVAYIIAGYKVIFKAVRNIGYGKVFDENFLMAVASIGAFFIGEYPEAVAVMLFYQIGELFEDYAVGKSRRSIAELMNIRPDYANLKTSDGVEKVSPDKIAVGDIILIKPGEKVPLDGEIINGESTLDTAALTGESLPRAVGIQDEILSGCINQRGLLEVKVTKEFGESTVSKILELMENAISKKAKTENFITRFAAVYTPAVVVGALALGILPPLIIDGAAFSDWAYRALNFLVVSCPCALVISVPLGFFGGIGAASKAGILVKGSNYLEAASKAEYVVMDKTGTLTKGVFEVEDIKPAEDCSDYDVLRLAALAEQNSNHPISVSLRKAWAEKELETEKELEADAKTERQMSKPDSITDVVEIAGKGVSAVIGDKNILVGNGKLMEAFKIVYEDEKAAAGTTVYVACDRKYLGRILISDRIKEDAPSAVSALRSAGINTVMLTGDSCAAAEATAGKLGVDRVFAELLPADKVEQVEELIEMKSPKGSLLFVGDGINDAPVLARADVGVAMGGLGSDAAIEAADVVIMDDKPSKLLTLMNISKKTINIVHQNIVFALGVKLIVLLLSAIGYGNLWAAVFADVGVSVIAILNSLRILKIRFE